MLYLAHRFEWLATSHILEFKSAMHEVVDIGKLVSSYMALKFEGMKVDWCITLSRIKVLPDVGMVNAYPKYVS